MGSFHHGAIACAVPIGVLRCSAHRLRARETMSACLEYWEFSAWIG